MLMNPKPRLIAFSLVDTLTDSNEALHQFLGLAFELDEHAGYKSHLFRDGGHHHLLPTQRVVVSSKLK
jgi:hypothetical protein